MADLGAAFGFYPQLNRRRQGSPADSANLPVDVLRGRLAGLLGLPADMANLLRSPSPTEMFGDVSYEAPAQFPYTTEKFLKDLPLAPTSRVGQVAGQAASFVPLNPMPAVRGVQKIGQMAGEELAATMMGQRPNSMMSKVVPQPLFAVAPEQGLLSTKVEPIESLLQTKPQAPVSDIGFYSATEQAALNLGRNKGTGQSFINDLMKAPDVKKEELAYTGLDDFLRDKPNVTKQEVQDFLANNRVDVQEVRLGEAATEDPIGIAKRKEIFDKYEPQIQALYKDMDSYGYDTPREVLQSTDNRLRKLQEMRDAEANAYYVIPESTPTRYQKYQLAGGENYREILLTLPAASEDALKAHRATKSEALVNREKAHNLLNTQGYTPTAKDYEAYNLADAEWNRIQKIPAPTQSNYLSSHFNEPNILAHMRVNDRVDADGKKMLLVEEIQSDWHQAGREKGYRKADNEKALEVESKSITEERKNLVAELSAQEKQNGFVSLENQQRWDKFKEKEYSFNKKNKEFFSQVPDAPFKDTWYQLALKRLTKYAADNGYERIGLTTGKQQASRFDLSKQVDELLHSKNADGTYQVSAQVQGRGQMIGEAIPENKLSDYVGKEVAEKIIKGDGKRIEVSGKYNPESMTSTKEYMNSLSGIDLKIGGEGMKKYYDEIYPKFLDKYGKKYGASVGETQITTDYARDASGIPAQRPSKETIRYLDITPQMKEGTSKGQPLFAATPLLPATSLLDEEKRKEITSLLE
jgi:hypothetical protein